MKCCIQRCRRVTGCPVFRAIEIFRRLKSDNTFRCRLLPTRFIRTIICRLPRRIEYTLGTSLLVQHFPALVATNQSIHRSPRVDVGRWLLSRSDRGDRDVLAFDSTVMSATRREHFHALDIEPLRADIANRRTIASSNELDSRWKSTRGTPAIVDIVPSEKRPYILSACSSSGSDVKIRPNPSLLSFELPTDANGNNDLRCVGCRERVTRDFAVST